MIRPRSWCAPSVFYGLALLGILALAAHLRTMRLDAWPIFADEDGYASTTRAIAQTTFRASIRVAPWLGDKPVLLFWAWEILWPWCGNPLMAGRWLSAIAGVASTCMCFALGRRISGNTAGLIAALVYATSPWAILQERQIAPDPVMTVLVLLSLLMILKQIERPTRSNAAIVGALGFVAVFAKPSAVLLVPVPLFAYLLWLKRPWRPEERRALAVMTAGPLAMFLVLKFFRLGASTERLHPVVYIPANLRTVWDAVHVYMSVGVAMLSAIGAALLLRKDRRTAIFCLCLMAGWAGVWIAISDFAPSRYDLPSTALAAILAGIGAIRILEASFRNSWAAGAVAAMAISLLLAVPARASAHLIHNVTTAPLTKLDDWQYRSGWPSGYAYADADAWLRGHVSAGVRVGYVVDVLHQESAGMFNPLPSGVVSLGLFQLKKDDSLPLPKFPGTVYLMVDDGRLGGRGCVEKVLRQFADASEVARFLKPGGDFGVSVIMVKNHG